MHEKTTLFLVAIAGVSALAAPARSDSLVPSGDATINFGSVKTNYGSAAVDPSSPRAW